MLECLLLQRNATLMSSAAVRARATLPCILRSLSFLVRNEVLCMGCAAQVSAAEGEPQRPEHAEAEGDEEVGRRADPP